MELRKTSTGTLMLSVGVFGVDTYFLIAYSREAAHTIGWGYVAGAGLTQCLVFLAVVLALANRNRLFRQDETSWHLDNFRKIGMFFVFVILGISLSITLLKVGIVCPEAGFPDSRGKPVCERTSAEGHASVGHDVRFGRLQTSRQRP
jgi:hypothetical protein